MDRVITLILIFIIILFGFSANCQEKKIDYMDMYGKTVMTIHGKDTCIYDTVALIRSLLRTRENSKDTFEYYDELLLRAEALFETVDGLMYITPKRKKYYIL